MRRFRVRDKPDNCPIMLLGTLLHQKLNEPSYGLLVQALQDNTSKQAEWSVHHWNLGKYLSYGADEEKAILSAIRTRAPEANIRVCVDHLYTSLMRAAYKTGISTGERYAAWEYITAMARIEDQTIFDENMNQLRDYWLINRGQDENNVPSNDRKNFGKRLIQITEKIDKYHRQPWLASLASGRSMDIYDRDYTLDLHYTNNNAEAVNAMILKYIEYQHTAAPKLFTTCMDIMKSNVSDVKKALCGNGKYILAQEQREMTVPQHIWNSRTEQQKTTHLNHVLRGVKKPRKVRAEPSRPQYVEAENEDFGVVATPGGKGKQTPVGRKGKTKPRSDKPGRVGLSLKF